MTTDKFTSYPLTPAQPATSITPITPDDVTDLAQVTIGLNVASAGLVQVTTLDGSIGSVFIAAGTAFPLRVSKVWATGTTATGIAGLY